MNDNDKKTILIAGYYGFGNAGDEAILSAILAELRNRHANLEFVVGSANPAETAAAFNVRSVGWKDVEALLIAAEESDLIILGGGGLFQDYWGVPRGIALTHSHWGISFCSAIGMLAVLYQKPFMIYSVGVGPLLSEEGRTLTRWTFDLATAATVRDQESRDLLVSLGVPEERIFITPDPALTLPLDSKSALEILHAHGVDLKGRPLIGVCIRNWKEGDEADEWKRALARGLDQFLDVHDVQIIFIPFQVSDHPLENDHAAAVSVMAMMQHTDRVCALQESYSPATLAGLLSYCQLLVGMRLHSLIFAANAGVPAVALAYDPKIDHFMMSLELSDHSINIRSMTGEQLAGSLKAAWEQNQQIRQTLQVRTDTLKGLSKEASSMALKLLEKKSKTPFPMEVVQALAVQKSRDLAEKEQEAQDLSSRLTATTQEAQLLQGQLNEILYSKAWKLVQVLRRVRIALMPVGSRREKAARILFQSSKRFIHQGIRASALARDSVRRHGLLGASVRGFRVLSLRLYHANKQFLHGRAYQRELGQLEMVISQHTGFFDLFHVPMGWNTALFQRFQHISLQTAKMGGLALYGGHPIVDLGITVFQNPARNLYIFDATNRQIVNRVFQALQKKQQPRILRVQSIDLVTTGEDVIRFIEQGFTIVYEYIDELNPAITGAIPDLVYQRHAALLKDERVIVVATSDLLFEDVARHRSRNFLLSTNGVDLQHWRLAKGEPPADLKPVLNGKLIVGYHGALAKWIDYDLLRTIADEGSYELVLIGFEHDREFAESGLKDHPRVHFLGSKTYFQLNTYAVHYDIAILPFKSINLTQSVSPVKIFEYMAAQKPIVTTDLRECKKYKSCLVAGTSIEFMEQLKRAAELRNDADYLRVLDKEAGENSWEEKTREILTLAGVKL